MELTDKLFQSTLPVWGATTGYRRFNQSLNISIHAPRVGSDVKSIANNKILW